MKKNKKVNKSKKVYLLYIAGGITVGSLASTLNLTELLLLAVGVGILIGFIGICYVKINELEEK